LISLKKSNQEKEVIAEDEQVFLEKQRRLLQQNRTDAQIPRTIETPSITPSNNILEDVSAKLARLNRLKETKLGDVRVNFLANISYLFYKLFFYLCLLFCIFKK